MANSYDDQGYESLIHIKQNTFPVNISTELEEIFFKNNNQLNHQQNHIQIPGEKTQKERRNRVRRVKMETLESCKSDNLQEYNRSSNKISLDYQQDSHQNAPEIKLEEVEVSEQQLFSQQIKQQAFQNNQTESKIKVKIIRKKSINESNQLTITSMTRRQKVQQYLDKKHHRIFKKVKYQCRKTVANARLRLKGRFISQKVAEQILGTDLSKMCKNQIKTMLQMNKFNDE